MKKRITFSLDQGLIKDLRNTSKTTMIPQSRLVEKAIQESLKSYK